MDKTERIKNIVWTELTYSCYWEQYISRYIGYKYDRNKLYSIVTIILSSISAFFISLSKEEYSWATWVGMACIVIVPIIQIVNNSQKHVMMDVETASSMLKLRSMYIEYYNDLARLYLDIDDLNLNNEEIKDRYFKLRDSARDIEKLKDSLNIRKLNHVNQHALEQMSKRLEHKFKAKTPEKNSKSSGQ